MIGLAGWHLFFACSRYETSDPPNDYCPNDDGVPPEEVEVNGRSLLDVVAWVDDTWQERAVTWQDGTQSTLSVDINLTNDDIFADDCDGLGVVAWSASMTLRLDDQSVFTGPGRVSLTTDDFSVSTRFLDEDAVVETVLAPPFQSLELDSLEVEGAFTDRGPERLILRDGSGAAFACDESVDGNCIADGPEPPP